MSIKRNVLLNPGPATTTNSVKKAQVVPDICPREKEFQMIMDDIRKDLIKIVHGDPNKYTSVLFCGSGTICMDICINSLVPKDKKILIINNGAYSKRAVEIANAYSLDIVNLETPYDKPFDPDLLVSYLEKDKDIAVVYATHNETGTGILNPIKKIGKIAHNYKCTFIVDTTSTYALLPIDIEKDNIDFCMASAQKGLMSMTGLSFVIGKKKLIEKSKDFPIRSYYCNLYSQYEYFEKTGQMQFTPPVQTIYATKQAIKEYFKEGEMEKYKRHIGIYKKLRKEFEKLNFDFIIDDKDCSKLILAVKYPDENWNFEKIHDYCYDKGFTIYPGKINNMNSFRLCSLGAITKKDIKKFIKVFKEALKEAGYEQ